ncbi:MAG: hypothetical protein NTV62_01905, partial [Candidatus Gribaldobacteria bacterium]|nr:hypothetical protein [Candidatus Gribaldobacteria bacterium]
MNKPIRVLIIWLSVAFFLVTGAYLYLYSQGIRVDLAKWRLVKTGGFEIQITSPSGVDIYLNGKKNKTTGFLSNSVFIKNLLPKTYKVEIKKAGYLTWQKSLLVEKGLVTKVPEIILFKENPSFETLNTNVNNFLISSDNQKVLIETQVNQSWSYLLQEASTFKNPTTLFSQSSLTDKKIVPIFQQWQDENKRILFTASTSLGNRALIVQYNNLAKPTILNLALEKDIEKITFLPNDLTKLVYLKAGNLYSLDYQATQPARKLLAN